MDNKKLMNGVKKIINHRELQKQQCRIIAEILKVDNIDLLDALASVIVKRKQRLLEAEEREELKIMEEEEDINDHIEIMQHDISYFLRDTELKIEDGDCEYEHIAYMIGQGYREGDLNKTDRDDEDNTFTGWWKIVKN